VSHSGAVISTYYYLRDAQGNEMCRYVKYTNTTSQLMYVAQEHSIYGSSRVGVDNRKDTLYMGAAYTPTWGGVGTSRRELGLKSFELANHLGNVLVAVSDKPVYKVSSGTIYFNPEITSTSDYYPFGAPINGRGYSSDAYRFGFNGKEIDHESETQDYGMRINDCRLARFLSVDPLAGKFAMLTSYQFASNRPIDGIDMDGLEYLRFDKVADIGNSLITYYDNNGKLGFPVVEYKGNKYYDLGFHLKNPNNQQITEWVYTPIAPVIPAEQYVGYGDVTPNDCMGACKKQVAKQGLKIGGYDEAIQMFKSGNQGNPVNRGLGVDLIQKSIEGGNSIIVGVDFTLNQKHNINTDNTTDHFITIVGRGNDDDGEFFTFYENGTSDQTTGTKISKNKLYIKSDGTLEGRTTWYNYTFTVTQVRPTEKKDE
jgi:RHS repeat-associated protein